MKRLLIAMTLLSACTLSNERSLKILRAAGYSEIRLTSYPFFACAGEDYFNQGFYATSPSGARVTGAVCCGAFKNCTVRVEP